MAINNFHFKLDIEREDYIPKFRSKQYDTAIFYVSLYKNGLPYHFENEQIKMFVKKTDGTIVYQEDNISIQDDEVKINVKNQALVCSGLTYAELEFKSSDGQVTSSTFVYEVKEKVGSDKSIESVTDIDTLDKLKKYMEDAKKELERFKNDLSKLEDLVANKDKLEGQNKEAKENIGELEKILENANNITSDEGKFITGNNVVSESTNGYIQDLKICGRSLVNILNYNTLTTTGSSTGNFTKSGNFIKCSVGSTGSKVAVLKPNIDINNKIVTVIIDNKSTSQFCDFGKRKDYITIKNLKSGLNVFTINTDTLQDGLFVGNIGTLQNGDTIEFSIMILEGDYTQNTPQYFEGLLSAGNGNKIEVSSLKWKGNLFDDKVFKPYITSENDSQYTLNYGAIWYNRVRLVDLPFKENTSYKFICTQKSSDATTKPRFYFHYTDGTEDQVTIANLEWETVTAISSPNKTLEYISATYGASGGVWTIKKNSICLYEDTSKSEYEPFKQDKKTILFKDNDNKWKPITNLPGYWENGKFVWGDTVELHSDGKYYLHVRTKTSKGTDLIGLVKEQNYPNRDGYYGFLPNKDGLKLSVPDKSNPYIICDKLKPVGTYIIAGSQYSDIDCVSYDPKYQCIRLAVPKGTNINTYLAEKNITFILPIDEKVYECLDISVRAFRNKTMLSIYSGAIDPGISYYVPTGFLSADNSISEKVETLDKYSEQNIKDINDLNFNMEQNYFNINRGILTDFNNGVQEGKYYLHSTSLIPNSPPTSQTSLYGVVQVFYKNYNELFQLVALHNSELWIRFRNGQDKWNPWNKILNSQDFETQHGSNGFLKFPNGSVLLFGSGVTSNGVLRINFKLTFAKSDDIVLTGSALDPSPQTVGFRNLTTTGCELTCSWAANPVGVKWFAFGKIQ